jgi:hypothetical protein
MTCVRYCNARKILVWRKIFAVGAWMGCIFSLFIDQGNWFSYWLFSELSDESLFWGINVQWTKFNLNLRIVCRKILINLFSKELHLKNYQSDPYRNAINCEFKIHKKFISIEFEVNNFTCIEFAKAFIYSTHFFSCVITICMRWCSE